MIVIQYYSLDIISIDFILIEIVCCVIYVILFFLFIKLMKLLYFQIDISWYGGEMCNNSTELTSKLDQVE